MFRRGAPLPPAFRPFGAPLPLAARFRGGIAGLICLPLRAGFAIICIRDGHFPVRVP